MQFRITSEAQVQLENRYKVVGGKWLKLIYDAEGCGCINSGVPMLQVMDAPEEGDVEAGLTADSHASPWPILYEARHEVFFEDQLTLDYNKAKQRFALKSNSQIYSNQIAITS